MRILAGGRVFIRQRQSPEMDCAQDALPERFKVLLCLLDGAERRRQIQAKLNVQHPRADGQHQHARLASLRLGARVAERALVEGAAIGVFLDFLLIRLPVEILDQRRPVMLLDEVDDRIGQSVGPLRRGPTSPGRQKRRLARDGRERL